MGYSVIYLSLLNTCGRGPPGIYILYTCGRGPPGLLPPIEVPMGFQITFI